MRLSILVKYARICGLCTILCICLRLPSALCNQPRPVPQSSVRAVAFSPDGKLLASGGFDGRVIIWKAATGERVAMLPECADIIQSLEFSPDGRILASTSGNRVRLWNTADWNVHKLLTFDPYVMDATFSPDGTSIAVAAGSSVCVCDAATGKLSRKIEDDALCVGCALGGRITSGGWDGYMVACDNASANPLWRIQVNELDLRSLNVSPNGAFVACGGWSETATVWDNSTGKKILEVGMGRPSSLPVSFANDSKSLIVGGACGIIKRIDIATGKVNRIFSCCNVNTDSIAYSPNEELIAGGYDDGTIRIWNAITGKMLREWKGHKAKLRR